MAKLRVKAEFVGKVKLENATGSLILTASTTHEELSKFAPGVLDFVEPIPDPAPVAPAK